MTDPMSDPKDARLDDFPYRITLPTRWGDNDMLGHVNNVVYQRFYEAVVVRFVMEEAGLDWTADPHIPLLVEALCRFHRPLSFPETVHGGLRVAAIGTSSVTYALALFGEGAAAPASTGQWVHVFVDRETDKPAPIPAAIRAAYEAHS